MRKWDKETRSAFVKKGIINLSIIMLSVAVIWLNLHFVNLPRWIGGVMMLAIAGVGVVGWMGKRKLGCNIAMTVINMIALLVVFAGTYCNPYWNSVTFRENVDYSCVPQEETIPYADAVADLACAVQHLEETHPLFVSGLSDEVEALYETARENLRNAENITANLLCKEIQQIFSSLGDGHTYIVANFSEYHYLKHRHMHDMTGDALAAINHRSMAELFAEKKSLFSYESEAYGMNRMTAYLSTAEDLDYLGFDLENGVTYTYVTATGERLDCIYSLDDFVTYDEYVALNQMADNAQQAETSFVSYEILPEYSLAVLTLSSCDYNEEYINCLKDMFTEVKEKGINNVCVDLRNNSGGSSLVANAFIRYLDVEKYKGWGQDWRVGPFVIKSEGSTIANDRNSDLLFTGNVYALTSVFTYSSAMDFAMLLTDNGLGTIIGEASGNRPNGYGDIVVFKLPKSGLMMQVSTKKWYRVDTESSEEWIEPDVQCESDVALDVLKAMLVEEE